MKRTLGVVALLFIWAPVSIVAVAQDQSDGGGAPLPAVSSKASLTVSGEGYWHREVYEYGDQPSISAYDSSGQLLNDGRYRYEYKMYTDQGSDSPRQQDVLGKAVSRSQSGRSKRSGAETLSGSFEIQGGQVVLK